MIRKVKHKYISKGEYPYNSISFTIEIDGKTYGDYYENIKKEEKYKLLKNLLYIKHHIIQELDSIYKEKKDD